MSLILALLAIIFFLATVYFLIIPVEFSHEFAGLSISGGVICFALQQSLKERGE